MEKNRVKCEYEVLSPLADVDPVPLTGISERVKELKGKTIGLFDNGKVAASPILDVIEARLKERFSPLKFSRYAAKRGTAAVVETDQKSKFEEWVKGVDTVIAAEGD